MVRNTETKGGIVIPTESNVYLKVEIIDDDNVTHTISNTYTGNSNENFLISGNYNLPLTDSIGDFKLKILNPNGLFTNKFNGGEIVSIYLDREDASTLKFRGKIDNVFYGLDLTNGFFLEIEGRNYPELVDDLITETYAGAKIDYCISKILNDYYSDITLTFWNGSYWATASYENEIITWSGSVNNLPTELINISFQDVKGVKALSDLVTRVNLEFYLEYENGWKLRLFEKDSIKNYNDSISYGVNLLSISRFGINNDNIFNRIRVFGKKESSNIILLKTVNDNNSQSNLWRKTKVIKDDSITNMEELEERSICELNKYSTTIQSGTISSLLLSTVKPGEQLFVLVPYCNLNGYYTINSVRQDFGMVFKTTITLSKEMKKVNKLFIEKENPEEFIKLSDNLNDMDNSYTIFFNEDSDKVSLVNAEIENEKVKLSSGSLSGTVTSETLELDDNINECEFRIYCNYETSNDVYQITNNGLVWETIDLNEGVHKFNVPGNKLAWRIHMTRSTTGVVGPVYESICVLYK